MLSRAGTSTAATVALALLCVEVGVASVAGPSKLAGGNCSFDNEPVYPAYFWDPTCELGMVGCQADGQNVPCRFCGGGAYENVSCTPASCHFPNEPFVPYFWDPSCELGMLGCWADGVHNECRFCGKAPYTSISCPEHPGGAVAAACTFKDEPKTRYGWDPSCREGMLGCLADGVHQNCRYCEEGDYANISCSHDPAHKKCTFVNEPTVPYFWDPTCTVGQLGCLADGVHAECRFCAHRPFESIPCPDGQQPLVDQCTFPPLRNQPLIPYYWEPTCVMGVLGCWADGLHAQCRYCGAGVYWNITCPPAAVVPPGFGGAAGASESQSAPTGSAGPSSESKQGAVALPAEDAAPVTAMASAAPALDVQPGEVQVNAAPGRGAGAAGAALSAGLLLILRVGAP